MLKKNSFLFGVLIGLILPALLFGIIYGLNYYTKIFDHPPVHLTLKKMLFVCSALNIIPFRYYFTKAALEKTGQGILAVTVFILLMVILAV